VGEAEAVEVVVAVLICRSLQEGPRAEDTRRRVGVAAFQPEALPARERLQAETDTGAGVEPAADVRVMEEPAITKGCREDIEAETTAVPKDFTIAGLHNCRDQGRRRMNLNLGVPARTTAAANQAHAQDQGPVRLRGGSVGRPPVDRPPPFLHGLHLSSPGGPIRLLHQQTPRGIYRRGSPQGAAPRLQLPRPFHCLHCVYRPLFSYCLLHLPWHPVLPSPAHSLAMRPRPPPFPDC